MVTECIDGVNLEIEVNGVLVKAREGDHYVPTTALCKAGGKEWHDFVRLKSTDAFLEALAKNTGLNRKILVQSTRGRVGSTWIHPQVVIKFAQWVSPEFDVLVTKWAVELLTRGKAEVKAGDVPSIPAGLPEILEALLARVESLERHAPAPAVLHLPVAATPRFTVQERLRFKAWHGTSKKQRAHIRRLANLLLDLRHGETPDVAGGPGGPCSYYGHQIVCLDEAIDRVREEYQRRDARRGPSLFAESKA